MVTFIFEKKQKTKLEESRPEKNDLDLPFRYGKMWLTWLYKTYLLNASFH